MKKFLYDVYSFSFAPIIFALYALTKWIWLMWIFNSILIITTVFTVALLGAIYGFSEHEDIQKWLQQSKNKITWKAQLISFAYRIATVIYLVAFDLHKTLWVYAISVIALTWFVMKVISTRDPVIGKPA